MSEETFDKVMAVAGLIVLLAVSIGYLRFLNERDDAMIRRAECVAGASTVGQETFRACAERGR